MSISVTNNITEKEWEQFLHTLSRPPFLQSWHMRALHEQLGDTTHVLALRKDDTVIGVTLCIEQRAKRGSYLYIPYGPVMTVDAWKHFGELSSAIKELAVSLRFDFVRSSPFILDSPQNNLAYSTNGWKPAPIHVLAEHIWWLEITADEDALQKGMRKTMRNSIRRATKDGVTIRTSTAPEDVDLFNEIHLDTVSRHKFVPYGHKYFTAQVDAFRESNEVLIFIAEHEGKAIAAAIMMFYGDMASYHHGASLSAHKRIPASYLLQWTAIQEAKKRGCESYNFWGIVPENQMVSAVRKKKHPFAGVTTFKTGFGGSQLDLLHAQDLPLTLKYKLFTRPFETGRRIRRGFWYS